MTKGALYWRLKDEETGKWSYHSIAEEDTLELLYTLADYTIREIMVYLYQFPEEEE